VISATSKRLRAVSFLSLFWEYAAYFLLKWLTDPESTCSTCTSSATGERNFGGQLLKRTLEATATLLELGAELVPNKAAALGPAAEPAANMPSPVLGAELMVLGAELVPNKGLGLNEKTPVLAGLMVLSEDSGVRLPPILFAIVRFAPLSDECEVD
jgi:hypothetical protein